ncbi:MAG: MFS transporter [Desulfobacteraceae bacterium]|jgi:UMF1 family MFS transporter
MQTNRKAIWGWALYDWANSAFATTVMAGFFPIYFKQYWSYGADVNLSTARLGLGNSSASLIVALLAPILGAIADQGTLKKHFLTFFAFMGIFVTALFFFIPQGQWITAIFAYTLAILGWSGANSFYDAMLPDVAAESKIDFVSSLGYSMGYLGGGILFLLNVIMTLKPSLFGLADASQAVRWSFVSVAIWWGCFSLFTLRWVPGRSARHQTDFKQLIGQSLKQLKATFREISRMKTILLFLCAYWCYIDGVDTIIKMAVDYGLSLGFAANDLIVALLMTQFVGFPAALFFGYLGQRWNVRKAIFIAIGGYMFITVYGIFMTTKTEFYLLALFIGLVQGGIQALSRSYYTRLIPLDKTAEFFGFYNMLGKFAAIMGPALMAIVGIGTKYFLLPTAPSQQELAAVTNLASRVGIASILLLFVVGAICLFFVDEEKGKEEANYLSTL